MSEKSNEIETERKKCKCGNICVPAFLPGPPQSNVLEDGKEFIAQVIPVWVCTVCGDRVLVLNEEAPAWVEIQGNLVRRSIRAINIAELMINTCPTLRDSLEGCKCECGCMDEPEGHGGSIH